MATAKKQKSGTWKITSYVGEGVTKSGYKTFTGKTKKETELKASRFLNELEHKKNADITIGEAIDQYIDCKKNILSPRTIMDYLSIRKQYIQDLMPININNINKIVVQKSFNEQSKYVSPKTIRNIFGLLSSSLKMQNVPVPKISLPQKEKKEMHVPTKEEIQILLNIFSSNEDMYISIMLAAFMGMRRSEICALTMEDCQNNIIKINKALVINSDNEWVIKPPKSVAGYRTLEMPNHVAEYFKKINRKPNERIIRINPNQISDRFAKTLKRHQELSKFRFHDLRHFNASVMLALGVPNKYAMELMGHATDKMLLNVYQHTFTSKRNEIAQLVNDFLNDTTQNTTFDENSKK